MTRPKLDPLKVLTFAAVVAAILLGDATDGRSFALLAVPGAAGVLIGGRTVLASGAPRGRWSAVQEQLYGAAQAAAGLGFVVIGVLAALGVIDLS